MASSINALCMTDLQGMIKHANYQFYSFGSAERRSSEVMLLASAGWKQGVRRLKPLCAMRED